MMFGGWILIAVLLYFLFSGQSNGTNFRRSTSAEEVLRDRFVRGEIDEETYNRMMNTLKNS